MIINEQTVAHLNGVGLLTAEVAPDTSLDIPANFSMACYRFTMEVWEPLVWSEFRSSTLRGGFGHAFKKVICQHPDQCRASCVLGNGCAYGYNFETLLPGKKEAAPRPFIIRTAHDRRKYLQPGDQFSFELLLIGHSQKYLPFFILFFRTLGEQNGLGRKRARCGLRQVEAFNPYQRGQRQVVYQGETETMIQADLAISGDDLMERAQELSAKQITLRFVTPTEIKVDKKLVDSGPSFPILIKALRRRANLVLKAHVAAEAHLDGQQWVEQAERIRIVACQNQWKGWSRVSGRQNKAVKMGGLTGRVTYDGFLQPYLPLLCLGELVHVGKKTVFGNGQYQIMT